MNALKGLNWGRMPRRNYARQVTPAEQRAALVASLKAQKVMADTGSTEQLVTNAKGQQIAVYPHWRDAGQGQVAFQIRYGTYVLAEDDSNNAVVVQRDQLSTTLDQIIQSAENGDLDDVLQQKLAAAAAKRTA